ncbi:unnamed protein product [Symbiodinium sp. CCMP2592]|nr:unnamed protein product [Symbiodinium sp. CCMP2592]
MASKTRQTKKGKPTAAVPSASVDVGTALAGHPTCEALLEAASVIKLEEFASDAVDQGGIRAFDLTEYRATMKRDGEYTCTTCINRFPLLGFAHKTIAPNRGRSELKPFARCCSVMGTVMCQCDTVTGSVKIAEDRHFRSEGGEVSCIRGWADVIEVRAASFNDPPGEYEVCNGDAYRQKPSVAFILSWAKAVTEKSAAHKDFAHLVKFVYLPEVEQFERHKWICAEITGDAAESLTLQGWRKICGLALVENLLRTMNRPCDATALEKWFGNKVKGMTAKTIAKNLRIHKRVTACNGASEIIRELDDFCKGRHALATTQGLDILCSKTNIQNNPSVSSQLLLWCLEQFWLEVREDRLESEPTKDTMTCFVNRALLKRRVLTYCCNKFRPQAKPVQVEGHAEGSASKETWPSLSDLFGSMKKFKASGLEIGSTTKMSWDYLSDVVDFNVSLIRGACDKAINTVLVEQGPMVSAEVFLRSPPFVKTGVWDVEATLRLKDELERPAVSEPEPAEPVPEQPKEPDTKPVEEPEVAMLDTHDDHEEPAKMDRCGLFDGAVIPQFLKDVFARIEDDAKFERMNTFMEILVAPTTAPNWRIALEKVVQEHDNMNQMFVYDVKRETKPVTKDAIQTPFRRMPTLEGSTFKHVLAALSLGRGLVLCVGLACFDQQKPLLKETSAVIVLDGRRQANTQCITSDLAKYVKKCPGLYPKASAWVSIRCMYHCREFDAGGALCMTRRGLSSTAPDPLENMLVVLPKKYKPDCRAIHAYNCDSYSRGWFGLGMKDKSGFDLTTLPEVDANLIHGGLKDEVKAAAVQGQQEQGKPEQGQSGDSTAVNDDYEDEEEAEQAPSSGPGTMSPSHHLLWAWEGPAEFYNAMTDAFVLGAPTDAILVDITPGSGIAAVVACKKKMTYVAFAANEVHARFIRSTVLAKIVGETILGDASWSRKRVLSREESLTGTSSTRSPGPSLSVHSPTAPSPSPKKAKIVCEKSSSSSSSSS